MALKRFLTRRFAVKAVAGFLLAYVVLLALVVHYQRTILYIANTERVGTPAEFGLFDMKVIPVKTSDGLELQEWFRPPKNGDKYTVVLFHGSYVSLGFIAAVVPYLGKTDHGLFLCEYRGFGDSTGTPTEEGLYTDARAAVKWLTENGYPADKLIFYGSSLGTGVAVQMATEFDPAMVVLHSPYTRIADIAKRGLWFFPVDLLLTDRFDSIGKIGKVHAPVLIVHGEDDSIIPIADARRLFDAANHPKTFMDVKGWAHNDLFFNQVIYKRIGAWIDQQIKQLSAKH